MSSKGLRLVQRNCDSTGCTLAGPSKSVQLCTPSDQVAYRHARIESNSIKSSFMKTSTIQECPKYQSVTSFADQVCREQHWMGLHRGVQTDRNCIINCRDPYTNELTAAEGESGWFPSGTLCDKARSGYCLSGRCVVGFYVFVFTCISIANSEILLLRRSLMRMEYRNNIYSGRYPHFATYSLISLALSIMRISYAIRDI